MPTLTKFRETGMNPHTRKVAGRGFVFSLASLGSFLVYVAFYVVVISIIYALCFLTVRAADIEAKGQAEYNCQYAKACGGVER